MNHYRPPFPHCGDKPPHPPIDPFCHHPHDPYPCHEPDYCPAHQHPPLNRYPSSGPIIGSVFALKNATPYLYDSSRMTYGQVLPISENVYTKVSRRDDPSCINLTARFDLTDTSYLNDVRYDFLRKYAARKYDELSGVLPIIKPSIKFVINYVIGDMDGCTVDHGQLSVTLNETHLHFTEVLDRFVQSANGSIIDHIPAMTYQGFYTFTIIDVHAYLSVVDTKKYLQDEMNPLYAFTDNNHRIIIHDDVVDTLPSEEVLFAVCDVNQTFEYKANITNRLRLSFTAFTSIPIVSDDVASLWFALNEPTEQTLTQLRNEVTAMEEELASFNDKLNQHEEYAKQLENQIIINKDNIKTLTERVTTLEQGSINQNNIIMSLIKRIEALEAIPMALVTYKAGKEILRSQITWIEYGELYQAAQTFTASGNFLDDVAAGYLVPVIKDASDYEAITSRIDTIDETINSTNTTINDIKTQINDINDVMINKVDKEEGKGLSSNDYTDEDKALLQSKTSSIEFGTTLEFPTIGEPGKLYISTDKHLSYIWDDETKAYVNLDKNNVDVTTIQSVIDEMNTAST